MRKFLIGIQLASFLIGAVFFLSGSISPFNQEQVLRGIGELALGIATGQLIRLLDTK